MEQSIQSEEDVKIKIVIPYLEELGFLKEELQCEMNFSLKHGKAVVVVGAKRETSVTNARLDILVQYQGKNICVFEVKKDTIKISEDDIMQAVSYASLIRPMPPFCIVSNGIEFVLVDTISRKRIGKEKIGQYKINGYEAVLPDEEYYERLKHFVGYSKDNLMRFCDEMMFHYMSVLKGSKEEREKKYISEIYEPSIEVRKRLDKFISQSKLNSFALLARSGMGKTCWACHIAEELITTDRPTLFYRAGDIKRGIFETITDDLNWTLSPQLTTAQGMKRFFDIFESDTVFVIVDGLDEIEINLARDLTEDFLRKVNGRNVKLIVTCKPEFWTNLKEKNDIPSLLYENTYEKGIILTEVNNEEFSKIIKKYRAFYNFTGLFQNEVLSDCRRNLYLLRVMFEVASNEKIESLTYTFAGFFKRYYEKIIKRFEIEKRDSAREFLNLLGKLICERDCDYIDIQELRERFSTQLDDSIVIGLNDLNVIDKRNGAYTDEIGFYFQRFRDYLISFEIYRWYNLSDMDLKELTSKCNRAKRSALELYYLLAIDSHKRVLDQPLYDKASEYVSAYENVLNSYFPNIKIAFTPYSNEKVGFVGYFDILLPEMLMYGFRKIKESEPNVLLIPASGIDAPRENNLAYVWGVETGMQMRYPSIFMSPINVVGEVLKNDIPKEFENVIAKGKLDESCSDVLLSEKLFAIGCGFYPEFVGSNPRFAGVMITGFSLKKLREGVLAKRAYRFLERKLIDNKLSTGEIPVIRQGDSISYSYRIEKEDKEILSKTASRIAEEGKFYRKEVIQDIESRFEIEILKNIEQLEAKGITEIIDPISARRKNLEKYNELKWGYSQDIEYAETFFAELLRLGIEEYEKIVECNFPMFKNKMSISFEHPVAFFVSLVPGYGGDRELHYIIKKYRPIHEVDYQYTVIIAPPTYNDDTRIYEGGRYELCSWQRGFFNSFVRPTDVFCSFDAKAYLLCIRGLVYKMIKKNSDAIITEISKAYGVDLKQQHTFKQVSL